MDKTRLEVEEALAGWRKRQSERADSSDRGLRISMVLLFVFIGVVALVSFSVGIDGNNGFFLVLAGAFVVWGVSYSQGAVTALGSARRDFAQVEAKVTLLLTQRDAQGGRD